MATDLRASASLVIAGLVAGKRHIERDPSGPGLSPHEQKLTTLGALIERRKRRGIALACPRAAVFDEE